MKNILIVEDNELNLKLFTDILEYNNYKTDFAVDGQSAYLKIASNSYDLVILDIQLPKLNGFEVLDKLILNKIKLPKILIVSAYAMDSDKDKAKNYSVAGYITKPIDINSFLNTVKSTLD